jgi:exodeoxyribonuclease VII small subunit
MSAKMTFEEANKKLEQTVKKMESGTLTLQQNVEEYAKACELIAYCLKELDNFKGQIVDINERIEQLKNGEVEVNV